jgi:hypothetical protein
MSKIETKDLAYDELKNGWGILTGELFDGTLIKGRDTVNLIPLKKE